MPKIKVLHIITRLDKGGSAQSTLLAVAGLDKEKFDVTLMSGKINDSDEEIANLLAQKKINCVLIPELVREINLWQDIRAFWKIYHFIKEGKFDIVHTHSSKAGILGRWAAKLAGVKIIIHKPHGHIFDGYFGWFKSNLFIHLERLTGLITDRIITLTQIGKEQHIKYRIAKTDKFVPMYSAIEIEQFSNFQADIMGQKERLNIPLGVPVIGTVSRLEPIKGNRYFIGSIPEVTKVFPALRVIIVGGGSEKKELERYVERLGLSKNVIFVGPCNDIREILSIFDIFVLSSLNEGMGRCLLEAQILGVPVVATKVGGIPEVVRDGVTGILVSSRKPDMMAKAIIKLLKDKSLREKMSEEAKRWVDSRFSLKILVRKLSDLYNELIKEKLIS